MADRTVESTAIPTGRDTALDALRGFIVVVMALDHANLFIAEAHSPGEHWFAMPRYDSALPFVTRLVTHPAAPGFFFLMGAGMVLFAESRRARGWSEPRLIGHFVARGLVLIGLQFTVVNLAWRTGPGVQSTLYLGVLAALGGGMILAGLALRLPAWALALAAAAFFLGMEFSHPEAADWETLFRKPLGVALAYSGGSGFFWSNYPVLAWLELVLLGMAVGKWLSQDRKSTYLGALGLGALFLVGFVLIRAANGFGNVASRQDGWIGFLNVVKYPPAMTFTLLTMGFNLIALWLFSRIGVRVRGPFRMLTVLGSVPLFFYVSHLWLYSAIGALEPGTSSYPTMYMLWIVGLMALYPACRWYSALKRSHPDSVLRFL